MSEKMSRTKVTMAYLNKDTARPVSNAEFLEFWKGCNEDERANYSKDAARLVGAEVSDK